MLPAQLVNVAESALPVLPTPAVFLQDLEKGFESLTSESSDVTLFGDTFAGQIKQPEGSTKNQKQAFVALRNFQKVCDKKGWSTENLDEYMVAFAKWVLSVKTLFETEAEMIVAKAKRQQICSEAERPFVSLATHKTATHCSVPRRVHRCR